MVTAPGLLPSVNTLTSWPLADSILLKFLTALTTPFTWGVKCIREYRYLHGITNMGRSSSLIYSCHSSSRPNNTFT